MAEFPEEKWDAIISIVLNAPFHASKAALPMMIEQGWGRIINTGEGRACGRACGRCSPPPMHGHHAALLLEEGCISCYLN